MKTHKLQVYVTIWLTLTNTVQGSHQNPPLQSSNESTHLQAGLVTFVAGRESDRDKQASNQGRLLGVNVPFAGFGLD